MGWIRIGGLAGAGLAFLIFVGVLYGAEVVLPALPGVIALAALSFQYTEKWRRPTLQVEGPERPPGYDTDRYRLRVVNHRLEELAVHFVGLMTCQGDEIRAYHPDYYYQWDKLVVGPDDLLNLSLTADRISHEVTEGDTHSLPGETIRLRAVLRYGAQKELKGKQFDFTV